MLLDAFGTWRTYPLRILLSDREALGYWIWG